MNTYQKEYEKYYYSLQKQIEDDKKKSQEDYENYNHKHSKVKNTKYDIKNEKSYREKNYIDEGIQEEAYDDFAVEKKIYKREKEKKYKGKIDKFIFQLGITFLVMAFYVGTAYIYPPIFNVAKNYTQKYCFSHELEYENLSSRYNSVNWEEIELYIMNNYNYFKNEIRSLL